MASPDLHRPRPGRRLPQIATAVLLTVVAGSASCALFQSEESLAPSPTFTVPAPTTTATLGATAAPAPTTTASLPVTTTSTAATTTTGVDTSLYYLELLMSSQAAIADLVEGVTTLNDEWNDRSRTRVSFSDTEAALEVAVERARALREAFRQIEPPPAPGLADQHRSAGEAVDIVADATSEMLDGLRSTDTGEARRAAMVGLLTAFDLLAEAVGRVAAIIGEEGEAMLAANRVFTPPPVTGVPGTTSTTAGAGPPPDPGNIKNCSDFSTQAEAQKWFDIYSPHYGDVALLDTNQNGRPCEQLP